MDGRIDNHVVDPELPPFEDGTVAAESTERPLPRPNDNMWEVRRRKRTNRDRSRSPPNIFINNRDSKEVPNAPRGRDLLGLNKNVHRSRDTSFFPRLETFLVRGRPLEMVRNDIFA